MSSFARLLTLFFCRANLVRLLTLVLFFPVTCIAKVFPKQKGLILFGARYGTFYDWEPRFIYDYICDQRDSVSFESVWVCRNRSVEDELRKAGKPVLRLYTLKAAWKALRAEYIVISTSPADIDLILTAGAKVIHTYHGMPIRKVAGDYLHYFQNQISNPVLQWLTRPLFAFYYAVRVEAKADYVITTSEFANRIWHRQYHHDPACYWILGNARNDSLFVQSPNHLREDPDEWIISYLPTDRGTTGRPLISLFQDFSFRVDEFDDLLKTLNARLVLKCHHRMFGIEGLEELLASSDRMSMYSGQDVIPVLRDTDVLISDYSSVIFNFLILNRPIILGAFDLESYEDQVGFAFDYRANMPGPICRDWTQIANELQRARSDDPWRQHRDEVCRTIHAYRDDQSCRRIVEFIESLN